jgi:hypothetical protein
VATMSLTTRNQRIAVIALLVVVLALSAWAVLAQALWLYAIIAVVVWLSAALWPPRAGAVRWLLLALAAGLLAWFFLATPHRLLLVFLAGLILFFVNQLGATRSSAASGQEAAAGQSSDSDRGSA